MEVSMDIQTLFSVRDKVVLVTVASLLDNLMTRVEAVVSVV